MLPPTRGPEVTGRPAISRSGAPPCPAPWLSHPDHGQSALGGMKADVAEAGGLAGFRGFQKGEEEGCAAAVLRPDQGPDSRAAWAEGPELFPGSVLLAGLLLLRHEVSRLVRLVRRFANTQPTAGTGRVLCKYRRVNIQRRSEGQNQ